MVVKENPDRKKTKKTKKNMTFSINETSLLMDEPLPVSYSGDTHSEVVYFEVEGLIIIQNYRYHKTQ